MCVPINGFPELLEFLDSLKINSKIFFNIKQLDV